ncbi:MAG TPA: lactate utilization protein [Actinomycetota bacterium]|jgi:L-lactate dehydrogenase complex protein LldG
MEREAFLGRVRQSLGDAPAADLPASFPATPASGTDATAERFLAELGKAGASGSVVARYELADAVADAARALTSGAGDGDTLTAVVAPDTDEFAAEIEIGLRVAGVDVDRPDAPGWREASSRAALGVTSAELGVASTGSVLIVPGAASPRVASLLPTAHLVVMPAGRLVAGLEDAMPTVAGTADVSSAPVLVTGPSRTSDIEMITVLGVHGPKALHVLLVGEW